MPVIGAFGGANTANALLQARQLAEAQRARQQQREATERQQILSLVAMLLGNQASQSVFSNYGRGGGAAAGSGGLGLGGGLGSTLGSALGG